MSAASYRPQSGYYSPARSRSVAAFRHDDDDYDMMMMTTIDDDCVTPRPHTSFHYYPQDEDDQEWTGRDCDPFSLRHVYSTPEDTDPRKLVIKHGYGYRKPDKEVFPHWSQWPQPKTCRPQQAPPVLPSPRLPYNPTTPSPRQSAVCYPVTDRPTSRGDYSSTTMKHHDSRNIILHRGLSQKRAAPPVMPIRSLTHYGSFGNRPDRSYYMDGLDRYSGAYKSSSVRQTKPVHHHPRKIPKGEGYLHNHSIYYSTTPNVSGYFIIHPDWVSERLSMRRAQSLLSF